MHALWFMVGALCVLAIAYRFYSAFLAARVLMLDDLRKTAAHIHDDGQNFHPTHKVVLFGHHFAAITGAGPLIGPVLAAQFGFLPGYLWILIGVVFGGAVHDLVILTASVRRGGSSLASIARQELGPTAGVVAGLSILFIIVVALAGLGRVVVGALAESAWGVFTIGTSIPVALLMGVWIHLVRKDSVRGIREATVAGVVVVLLAVVFGKQVQDSAFGHWFQLRDHSLIVAIALYGFCASVLPVWLLLCPRDYLSSYLKIGTILLLVVGVVLVNPLIVMPMWNTVSDVGVHVNGTIPFMPVVKGSVVPFVFITIACGAISGFHALVGSGTTPKMIDKETDMRAIGYGAMLMEGLVAVTALIAATALPPADYFAINTNPTVAVVPTLFASADALQAARADMHPDDIDKVGRTTLSLSDVLHLHNQTLAVAGFHVDKDAVHASDLSAGDFARLGVRVDDLPRLSVAADEGRQDGRSCQFGRGHGADFFSPAGHETPAVLLVSFCDHVRGALRPDDNRYRYAGGAIHFTGIGCTQVKEMGQSSVVAGIRALDGHHRRALVLADFVGLDWHHLADVWHREPAAGVGGAHRRHDGAAQGSAEKIARAGHRGTARICDDDNGDGRHPGAHRHLLAHAPHDDWPRLQRRHGRAVVLFGSHRGDVGGDVAAVVACALKILAMAFAILRGWPPPASLLWRLGASRRATSACLQRCSPPPPSCG
jgi:carbon starvation protein CstA